MASADPAFQWETEMLRSSRRHAPVRADRGERIESAGDWLSIREASEATGVPSSTIRKWARHDNIPSFLEKTADGYLRIVSMSGIERWTDEIGRDLPERTGAPSTTPERERSADDHIPDGSMLVPLDAWNRMLNQLGNLHEAGQQLAEARERAAKAETEARFLKERLAELRSTLDEMKEPREPDVAEPAPAEDDSSYSPSGVVRALYRGWRARRRNRR